MYTQTGKQRRELRSQAHHLEPVVIIGQHGVTDKLVQAVDAALAAHGLIKIRYNDFKNQKSELSTKLAADTQSEVIGTAGHVVILYRPKQEKPDADEA